MDSFFDFFLVKAITGAAVGPVLGSFVTMLSYRLPRKLSIINPPSYCPECNARLNVRDLIPLYSWVKSKGLCTHCGKPIDKRYPIIELATATAVFLAFLVIGFTDGLLPILAGIVAVSTGIVILVEKSLTEENKAEAQPSSEQPPEEEATIQEAQPPQEPEA